jgi:hypothetical protein
MVLTITEADIAGSIFPRDDSLMHGLETTEIHRVANHEPRWLLKKLARGHAYRIFRFIFYPFVWEDCALWPWAAFRTARRLVKQKGIDVVYVSCAPFSGLLLGLLLKWFAGTKLVADFRDPFTESYTQEWPSKVHWYVCRLLEQVFIRQSDRLIVNTPAVMDEYIRRGIIPGQRVCVITNGFDS